MITSPTPYDMRKNHFYDEKGGDFSPYLLPTGQYYSLTLNQILTEQSEKILLLCLSGSTIPKIAEALKLNADTVRKIITRTDITTGLVVSNSMVEDLHNKSPEGATIWLTTDKGEEIITSRIRMYLTFLANQKIKQSEIDQLNETIEEFAKFFGQEKYRAKWAAKLPSLEVQFKDILEFKPSSAELLLDNPEEFFDIIESSFSLLEIDPNQVQLIILGLPKSARIGIGAIRAEHVKQFLSIAGLVSSHSDVFPQATCVVYRCPACDNRISILQFDKRMVEPKVCSCGVKGKFRIENITTQDTQIVYLEELGEELEMRSSPSRLPVILKGKYLTALDRQPYYEEGRVVRMNGTLKQVPITLKSGGKGTKFQLLFEANSVEYDPNFEPMELTPKDLAEIKKLSKEKDLYKKLCDSIAPEIMGLDEIKTGLLLSVASGGDPHFKGRDDAHVLLIGDPGTGKSKLLLEVRKAVFRNHWVDGKGASGPGLIGAVVKDEIIGKAILQGGALSLSNQGVCFCDELDKMPEEHIDALHGALENQFCSINKWSIRQIVPTDTTFIATANPKFGRFTNTDPIVSQLDLPLPLLSRMDLIFCLRDVPSQDNDKKLVNFMLRKQSKAAEQKNLVPIDQLRKYIHYARTQIKPKLSDASASEIEDYYVRIRATAVKLAGSDSTPAIPIGPRQIDGLRRLTLASAKLRLDDETNKEDALLAIRIMEYSLRQVSMDLETNEIDIDALSGMPSSLRKELQAIDQMITAHQDENGCVSLAQLQQGCGFEVQPKIDRMVSNGDLMCVAPGIYKRCTA